MNATSFRATLERLGLSQAETARLLGIKSPVTVFRWAKADSPVPPPAEAALVLIEALGVKRASAVLRDHWGNRICNPVSPRVTKGKLRA
jgi:transcriptional regulator with XRE-family HTH domain